MSNTDETAGEGTSNKSTDTASKITLAQAVMQLKEKRFVLALLMGFSSGLPLMLTLRTMQIWMREAGIDLTTIGAFALVQTPYTLKFLWSPFLDRYSLPFLGRRRGWLMLFQILLAISIFVMSFVDPASMPWFLGIVALIISFTSATQDILVDSYRRETLADSELGMGSTIYMYGYRVAMFISTAGALYIADFLSWNAAFMIIAACMGIGIVSTLWADEPDAAEGSPKTLQEAVVKPFQEFLSRNGAWLVLGFILLYKVGDTMAGNMVMPFYTDLQFTKTEIATMTKVLGLISTLVGAFIGGLIIFKLGIYRSLWVFGIGQALSTALFALLNEIGHNLIMLGVTVAFEDLTAGMGTAAFLALMAKLTDKRFTATQYALLTSLMGVPRVFIAAPTGFMAETMGWTPFFLTCAIVAIPGLLMINYVRKLDENPNI